MSRDNRPANPQSHSNAVRFGREEPVEDAIHVLRLDAASRILDSNHQICWASCLSFSPPHVFAAVYGPHCFDSIHNQVQDDLLQLHAMGQYLGQFIVQMGADSDAMTVRLTMHQRDHFRNELFKVDKSPFFAVLLEHRPNAADHVSSPTSVADDLT